MVQLNSIFYSAKYFILHVFTYFNHFHFMYFTLNFVVVSITFSTNGDNVAGSEFNITATINISEIIEVQSLNITWLHSNGNTIETAGKGQLELNPSAQVVFMLDLVFSNLLLSQAGVYTLVVNITDTNLNTVTLQRTYQVTIRSKCSFLLFICSFLHHAWF